MRLIPKGSLLRPAGSGKLSQESKKHRDIWDDYLGAKKGKARREYEKDEEGRFVVKHPPAKERTRLHFSGDPESEGQQAEAAVELKEEYYRDLEERLGYHFQDIELLKRALTHRSVLRLKDRTDYERLEFLGDAVLDLGVAHLLSLRHPEAREGDLSKMRAALVNTQALADIAKRLQLGPYIRLGRSELASGGAERPSILADVTEAIFGAMYWDSAFDRTLSIIEQVFGESLEVVTPSDPKTELQEALHVAGSEAPNYMVELVEGPEHAPTFVTVVMVDGEIVGRGRGATKKAAHQEAASEALSKLIPNITQIELKSGQNVLMESALLLAPAKSENGTKTNQESAEVV